MSQFALIDLDVYLAANDCWQVKGTAHVNPSPGDDNPAEYGDTQEYTEKQTAIDGAKAWADLILAGEAKQVTILLEGNELATLYAPLTFADLPGGCVFHYGKPCPITRFRKLLKPVHLSLSAATVNAVNIGEGERETVATFVTFNENDRVSLDLASVYVVLIHKPTQRAFGLDRKYAYVGELPLEHIELSAPTDTWDGWKPSGATPHPQFPSWAAELPAEEFFAYWLQ